MATDVRTLNSTHSDDATFRAAAQGVHDAIVAAGLVQTSDTGQINLATAIRTASANTAVGYEIFRFSDSSQATMPIFLKLEYGSGPVNTRLGLWATWGTATNGAGTISANPSNRIAITTGNSGSGPMYTCHAEGSFALIHWSAGGNSSYTIGCFRMRDPVTFAFLPSMLVNVNGGQGSNGQFFNFPSLAWTTETALNALFLDITGAHHQGATATDIEVSVAFMYRGVMYYFDLLVVHTNDVVLGTPFALDMPEGSRTFMPMDAPAGISTPFGTGSPNARWAFIWE